MEDISVFTDKLNVPTEDILKDKLGDSHILWQELEEFVLQKYPGAKQEWNYPGKKYGWSYRMEDKKRAIIYFLPREEYFKGAFVFGQKATDIILASTITDSIKTELEQAKKYAEGWE